MQCLQFTWTLQHYCNDSCCILLGINSGVPSRPCSMNMSWRGIFGCTSEYGSFTYSRHSRLSQKDVSRYSSLLCWLVLYWLVFAQTQFGCANAICVTLCGSKVKRVHVYITLNHFGLKECDLNLKKCHWYVWRLISGHFVH